MDTNQEITDDLLEYLEGCCRPLCMIFTPFRTVHHPVFDLATLLEFYEISPLNKIEMKFKSLRGPLDVVDVYVGKEATDELSNFVGFLKFNDDLETSNGAAYTWRYSDILVLGRNRLADVPVDIPMDMFPWTSVPFSFVDDIKLFRYEIFPGYVSQHKLVRCCISCRKTKKRCVSVEGMECESCAPGCCQPSEGEEYGRAEHFYQVTAAHAFVLSPPYQHLIQCVKEVTKCNKNPKMNATMRKMLKVIVQTRYFGSSSEAEEIVKANARSVQTVEFRNGYMKIVSESNMEEVFGFNAYETTRNAKIRVACVTPHLGLADPKKMYSIIDASLSRPGEIFYLEDSVMFRVRLGGRHIFRPTRIYMVGGVKAEDHMTFVVGWTY